MRPPFHLPCARQYIRFVVRLVVSTLSVVVVPTPRRSRAARAPLARAPLLCRSRSDRAPVARRDASVHGDVVSAGSGGDVWASMAPWQRPRHLPLPHSGWLLFLRRDSAFARLGGCAAPSAAPAGPGAATPRNWATPTSLITGSNSSRGPISQHRTN